MDELIKTIKKYINLWFNNEKKKTPSIHNFIKLYNNKISKFEEKKVVIDVRKKSEKLIAKKVNGKSRSLNLIILTKSDPIPS
jgi:hypothetical protein